MDDLFSVQFQLFYPILVSLHGSQLHLVDRLQSGVKQWQGRGRGDTQSTSHLTQENTQSTPHLTQESTQGTPNLTQENTQGNPNLTQENTQGTPNLTQENTQGTPHLTQDNTKHFSPYTGKHKALLNLHRKTQSTLLTSHIKPHKALFSLHRKTRKTLLTVDWKTTKAPLTLHMKHTEHSSPYTGNTQGTPHLAQENT